MELSSGIKFVYWNPLSLLGSLLLIHYTYVYINIDFLNDSCKQNLAILLLRFFYLFLLPIDFNITPHIHTTRIPLLLLSGIVVIFLQLQLLLLLLQRNLKLKQLTEKKRFAFCCSWVSVSRSVSPVLSARFLLFCGLPNAVAPQSQSTTTLIKTNGKNKQEAAKTKSKLIKRIAAQKFRLTYAENCCFSCRTKTKMKTKKTFLLFLMTKRVCAAFLLLLPLLRLSAVFYYCFFSCCTEKPSLLLCLLLLFLAI